MVPVANPFLRSLVTLTIILSLLSVTGCGGCWRQPDEQTAEEKKEEEEKKKKRLKPDFESLPPQIMPGVMNDPIVVMKARSRNQKKKDKAQDFIEKKLEESRRRSYAKPGHWYDVRYQVIANNYDVKGSLQSKAVSASSKPISIPGTSVNVSTTRPAALSKGEWKTFETSVFVPSRDIQNASATVLCDLRGVGGGTSQRIDIGSSRLLRPHQHHFVVLTTQPDSFKYLEMAPTIRLPRSPNEFSTDKREASYIVIPSPVGMPVPLPRQPLNWTTIAYLIWDDLDPDMLDQSQQTAMLDWLHFGGQLIISGPDSLERLENSFLGDYLPATSESAVSLTDDNFTELNKNWSLPEERIKSKTRDLVISKKNALVGIEFAPHVAATFVEGTGELVIERQLGRGRIVATSFSLKAPAIQSWRSFDSFLNSVLMRRPGRLFADIDKDGLDGFKYRWIDDGAHMNEPMLHTAVRFLSRDMSNEVNSQFQTPAELTLAERSSATDMFVNNMNPPTVTEYPRNRKQNQWHYGGFDSDVKSGLGGWDDTGPVADSARDTLTDAAGIAPPSASLVLKLLAGYLVVLVPINWLLFRSIGKVEYAWVAAPIIAIVGAVVVIRMASLDIGFTRANTQICILEMQADYDRGHLTEYSALYTSLSTNYQIRLDNLASQALPFPTKTNLSEIAKRPVANYQIDRTTKSVLKGIQIQSNTTELLHAEHVVNVGGNIAFEKKPDGSFQVSNNSRLTLNDVIVVGGFPGPNGLLRKVASLDLLAPGDTKSLSLIAVDSTRSVTQQLPVYFNPAQFAEDAWESTYKGRAEVTMDELMVLDAVQEKPAAYQNWLLQRMDLNVLRISRSVFKEAYQDLNPSNNVTLGRLLDRVDQTLPIDDGQFRLYAATNELIGNTKIEPDSTQVDRQTLVVVHLTKPSLIKPVPDKNSPADFGADSTLDREFQILGEDDPDTESQDSEDGSEKEKNE